MCFQISVKKTTFYDKSNLSVMSIKLVARRNPLGNSNIRVSSKEFGFFHSILQAEISFIDSAYVRSLFLGQ